MKETLRPAIVSLLAFTVLCGFVYPLVMDGIAAVAFPHQATGSLIDVKDVPTSPGWPNLDTAANLQVEINHWSFTHRAKIRRWKSDVLGSWF